MTDPIFVAMAAGILAIIYGGFLARSILKKPTGSQKMVEISDAIKTGAKAYLNRQYKTIAVIAVILFVILWLVPNIKTTPGFFVGAFFSAIPRSIGMKMV